MIQGQFDAASKLGASASHQSSRESDEHASDQQPRKRRKTSPPVEDSIEVAADSPTGDAVSSVEGDGNWPVSLREGGTASPNSSSINNANQIEMEDVPAKTESHEELERMGDSPAEQEIVSLEVQDPPDDTPMPERIRGTGAVLGVSDPPNPLPQNPLPHSDDPPGHGPPTSALTAPKAIETQPASERPSGQNSPAPGALPSTQDGSEMTNALKLSHPPKPPQLQQLRTTQHRPCRTSAPSTGPSTPKQVSSYNPQIKGSSPLSSPPTELFDPFDDRLAHPAPSSSRPSSPVSEDTEVNHRGAEEEGDDESDQSLSQEHFNRSSTFRRSLSTLKGRELFDAAIWADPLKTSVFYTFATNLRQKSRDASPTGCHHFISHLSKAGKMVRCYTQNIDLLEDKVGLSTRLLLGPGSRSRFSTRSSAKNAAGSANSRNPGDHNHQPAVVPIVPGPAIPGDVCQRAVDGRDTLRPACDTNSQAASASFVEEVDIHRPRASAGDHGVAERDDQGQGQKHDRAHGEKCEQDAAAAHAQPVDTSSTNHDKSVARTDPGSSTPDRDRGVECVFLHGSLRALRCFQCGCVANWDEGDRELQTMSGSQPPCPRCEHATVARQERGKRALGVGKLRPDIVLYGEEHPDSQQISTIIQHDISLAPDMLIVMGTSLKVHGLKTVVREFAKAVHNRRDGKVIFVNYTKPAESVWADTFDFWVEMDCDAWIEDLREKKPIIWLPPGSIEEEPRSTKRRRAVKDETEKKDLKKTKKVDDARDVKVDAIAPAPAPAPAPVPALAPAPVKITGKRSRKVEKGSALEANKPVPKRPAAFRDCKQNAAYWTTKIWSHLAAMSGRVVTPLAPPSPSKVVLAAKNTAPPSAKSEPVAQGSVKSVEPVKTRRGPRTKNAKSRKAILMASESSDFVEEHSKTPGTTLKPAKEQPGRRPKNDWAKPQTSSALDPSTLVAEGGIAQMSEPGTKQEALDGSVAPDDITLAEVPVPNTAPSLHGEDNSILAAVKSHHRIRRPKAIFGDIPPSSDPPSRLVTSGSKSKARTASSSKKAKSSVKAEENEQAEEVQHNQASTGAANNHMHVLPKPTPRAEESQTSIYTSRLASRIDESCTLAPIQPVEPNMQTANLGRRGSLLQLVLGQSPAAAPNATTPPAYLEPTVSPSPEDVTPIMSPNHWRNRAFTFADPLSRHTEPPRRPLDYTELHRDGGPDSGPGVPAHAHASFQHRPRPSQQPVLVDSPQLCTNNALVPSFSPAVPNLPVADDSPSRQLQRETDAATALSQMSQWAVYDNRQFARI